MIEAQIKHMVDRFLGWRLPENFAPDAGISFKAAYNEHTAHPMKHEPVGTNLFDFPQAEAMVRYMLEGFPTAESHPEKPAPDWADDIAAEIGVIFPRDDDLKVLAAALRKAKADGMREAADFGEKKVIIFKGAFFFDELRAMAERIERE